jgi:hypothetical protein
MNQPFTEKRAAARRRVFKAGTISFHQLGSAIDCTVRSLSETGACLFITSPVGIPDEFDLLLESDRTTRRCRVAWRAANKIGVMFSRTD